MSDIDLQISDEAKKELLAIARDAIEVVLAGQQYFPPMPDNPELMKQFGLFVTLTNRGELRGCLGRFTPDQPVYQLVAVMAAATATEDLRFAANPVTTGELPELDIKVSLLSPRMKIASPEEVEVGKHGIYISCGLRNGCYLPEVATDWTMSREEFLSSCCASKAGLPPDAWKSPDTNIEIFTTIVFSEEEMRE